MKVWTIGVNGIRRLLRERSNIFFVFILPLAIIMIVGAQFGASGIGAEVVVSHGGSTVENEILERVEASGVDLQVVDGEAAVVDEVERGLATAGIVFPPGFGDSVTSGEVAEIGFVSRPESAGSLQPILTAAVADATASYRVAVVVAAETDRPYTEAVQAVELVEVPGVQVTTERVGELLFGSNLGQFSLSSFQQLVLFVFLTTLTGSAALIQSRQLGVSRRMLSTPTSVGSVVVGEGMARFFVGVFQGIYILVVTLVAFSVDWGNLLGASVLLVALAAVGAGAAMLLGSLFRNDQQAGGFAVMIALGLGALGGCMLPLELFSPTLRRIAHITPHAWANDGFAELVYGGGSLADILPEVGVLAAYAIVLLSVAGWRLRRVLTAP